MKIVELFRRLSYGELSNLSISQEGSGHIKEERQPQLVQYVNSALLALHSRFVLSEKELLVEQVSHITNYRLIKKYAECSGSAVDWPYIKDLPGDPYEEDLIRILEVYDNKGCRYPLNDIGNCNSLFTPEPNVLQVPNPVTGVEMSVIYQASHKKLDDREGKILDQEICIPLYLEKALQLYVAHEVFNHMNGQENIIKGKDYLAAYEAICLELLQSDLVNQTSHTSHGKFEQRGFV